MIKNLLLTLCFIILTCTSFAQTMAYSTTIGRAWGSGCIDLELSDNVIKGHQLNVTVSYYLTENDANNQANILPRFYLNTSNPQTIYARVDNDLNSDFAVAMQTISYYDGTPPPPPGTCSYQVCDVDNDSSEIVYLGNLFCGYAGFAFPDATFCASDPNDVERRFYLSQDDAINDVNEVTINYTLTGLQDIYYKIINVSTNQSSIGGFSIDLITCTVDSDGDGIPDLLEDANQNLNSFDDDTDLDGLKNFEDNDDDGDNILSIDEDYNGNGDPSDDDTDASGVPDYLEANIALSTHTFIYNTLKVYPNPAEDQLFLSSTETLNNVQITLYTFDGKRIFQKLKTVNNTALKLDISNYPRGLYFIEIGDESQSNMHKIILK